MKALVLAGGYPQIYLLKELKSRGIETLLADYYPNPVAKPYADKFFQESTLDVEAIERVARENKVDFLITACTDQALLTVATVSEKLGLPCYIDAITARNVTNKRYMKEKFKKFGVPTADFTVTDSLDVDYSELEFPLVVKPVDCNSSKGVKKVLNDAELKTALENALEYSRTGDAIIEEFKEGKEISVDLIVENGVAQVLCVTESKKAKSNDKFVICETWRPAGISDKALENIKEAAQKIVNAFELKNCPMLIQLINKGDEVFVIEFSARTGGGLKFRIINQASGIDILKAVVDMTLGNEVCQKANINDKCIINDFIYCNNGVFDHMDGVDELVSDGTIVGCFLFKNPGEKFEKIENSGDRVAGYTIIADTEAQLKEKRLKAINSIKVIAENGEDIMNREILLGL